MVVSNLFMVGHDEMFIVTAPPEMKPKMWKRYMGDSFEIIKKTREIPSQITSIVQTQVAASNSQMNWK